MVRIGIFRAKQSIAIHVDVVTGFDGVGVDVLIGVVAITGTDVVSALGGNAACAFEAVVVAFAVAVAIVVVCDGSLIDGSIAVVIGGV